MAAVTSLLPPKSAQAPVALGNDKFSMVTVPATELGDPEAVFVLNHLTGVLTGAFFSSQTQAYTQRYVHNVAADFNTGSNPEPKYAIVSCYVPQLRASGGVQPASGLIHVAELSSGLVITYGYARPSGKNVGTTMALAKLAYFQFAEAVGQ